MPNNRTFSNQEEAFSWMHIQVDDDFIDNNRLAYLDDAEGMAMFEKQELDGCCGSFSAEVVIDGRSALIGCNYGH